MAAPPDEAPEVWRSRSHPVREDIAFQRMSWRVQRGGWLAMVAVAGLALLGLFSNGPLSSATATGAGGRLELGYERFLMNGSPTTMRVRVASDRGQATLLIGASFLEAFRIETTTPEPAEQSGGPDGVEMTFAAAGDGPLVLHFGLRPDAIGRVRSEIRLPGEAPARLTQFVYP
jgi:hypothetical protein